MNRGILYLLFPLLACIFIRSASAQGKINPGWDAEKIKGVRFLPHPPFAGHPFLTDTWVMGKIEFTDGETADSLILKYSSYKDELVYYNQAIKVQIMIDKASLKGFEYKDTDGNNHVFRKQYFGENVNSDRFFEVISRGKTDLLAFREVDLVITTAYKDNKGVSKGKEYVPAYQYFFYSPEHQYAQVRTSQGGFLAKFDRSQQRPIRKALRKNRIVVKNEKSLVQGWKLIEKAGYQVNF